MKKILLHMLFLFFVVNNISSQEFILQKDGFIDSINNSFIVYVIPEKSQNQLYNEVLMSIGRTFISPKDVISKVADKQIVINGNLAKAVYPDNPFQGGWDLNFTITFEFKDNKIKVCAPIVNSITKIIDNKFSKMYIYKKNASAFMNEWSIFQKDGRIKNSKAKLTLETSINSIIKQIIEPSFSKTNNEDW